MMDDEGEESIQRVDDLREREIEIYRREKELAKRELEFTQEIAMLRINGRENIVNQINNNNDNDTVTSTLEVKRMKLTIVMNLVSEFNGVSCDYNSWEKKIKFIKTTYKLPDDLAKMLIAMKLKDEVENEDGWLNGSIRSTFKIH
jgi:hypothetical protein